jgi:hypothetical protein
MAMIKLMELMTMAPLEGTNTKHIDQNDQHKGDDASLLGHPKTKGNLPNGPLIQGFDPENSCAKTDDSPDDQQTRNEQGISSPELAIGRRTGRLGFWIVGKHGALQSMEGLSRNWKTPILTQDMTFPGSLLQHWSKSCFFHHVQTIMLALLLLACIP